MADPYAILAPLVEPPLPPVPVLAAAHGTPWGLLAAALAGVGLLGLLLWLWRRAAPQRALRRIARMPDAVQGAHALARWQHRFARAVVAPPWQQALDRLRFGPADAAARDTLQRLCAEAAGFTRTGRAR